jgi:NAD+ kinase
VFRRIGIVAKQGDAALRHTLQSVLAVLARHDADVVGTPVIGLDAAALGYREGDEQAVIADRDLIIAIGGDGTLLRAGRLAFAHHVPVLGVNLGRLGFLADLSPQQVTIGLDAILAGRFIAEDRFILQCEILRDGQAMSVHHAMNDIVIQRWHTAHLITLNTYVDGRFVHTQRSDGMIVSTPTGSTAYSLSGGGPILDPSLQAVVLVPICPHTLTNRPLVIGSNARVEIDVASDNAGDARVTADGNPLPNLAPGDRIRITRHVDSVRLIHPSGHDHFATLRAKLHWGRSPC